MTELGKPVVPKAKAFLNQVDIVCACIGILLADWGRLNRRRVLPVSLPALLRPLTLTPTRNNNANLQYLFYSNLVQISLFSKLESIRCHQKLKSISLSFFLFFFISKNSPQSTIRSAKFNFRMHFKRLFKIGTEL